MSKPRETYRETYRAGEAKIRRDLLPERLPYMRAGWRIESMEMRAAGALDDGREYQDVRVYLEEAVTEKGEGDGQA